MDVYYVPGPDPDTLQRAALNRSEFVFYDNDYNCVSGCQPLEAWAAEQDDGGAFGICTGIFGVLCTSDAEQIRNKIAEVVEQQTVFAADGTLRTRYIALLDAAQCSDIWSESGPCTVVDFEDDAVEAAKVLPPVPLRVDALKTATLRRGLGPRLTTVDAGRLARATAALTTIAIVYRNRQATNEERAQRIEDALRTCYESKVIEVADLVGELHPCEGMPMFLPGEVDAGQATVNTSESIKADFTKHVLVYASEAEREQPVKDALLADGNNPVNPRQWYRQYEDCNFGEYDGQVQHCDEYPYYSSTRGGPPALTSTTPEGSRIRLVPKEDNTAEGSGYIAFLTTCSDRVKVVPREPFLVIPRVGADKATTDFVCAR